MDSYAACINVDCTEYELPKNIGDFPPEWVQCGGCGGPIESTEPPPPEETPAEEGADA